MYFSKPLGVTKRLKNPKKSTKPCTKKQLQYHNKPKNVYTNLDSITHSPFHSTCTHHFFFLHFVANNVQKFHKLLQDSFVTSLVENNCSHFKALGRLLMYKPGIRFVLVGGKKDSYTDKDIHPPPSTSPISYL